MHWKINESRKIKKYIKFLFELWDELDWEYFVGDAGTGSCGLCEFGAEDVPISGFSVGFAFLLLHLYDLLCKHNSHQCGLLALAKLLVMRISYFIFHLDTNLS